MTIPEPPPGGVEYPSLENSSAPTDPYAPVDYPTHYPGPTYGDYPPPAGYPPPPPQYSPGYPPPPGYAPGYPQAYPGYPPYDPYNTGKPHGTNGKAIAALVTAISGPVLCGLPSIAGIILGIIAMRETKRTGQDGYGLALAGLIIGCVVVVLVVLYILFMIVIAASSSSYNTY
ncbi:hypothetical protein BH11ACT6_BH11ACT6_59610 [soil metagenome]